MEACSECVADVTALTPDTAAKEWVAVAAPEFRSIGDDRRAELEKYEFMMGEAEAGSLHRWTA